MESSLASLFMEGSLPCLPLSWATSGESVEELQEQLTSTSLELQSAREAARLQSKIDEARISQLKGLLDAARKERDEARKKCSKLREYMLRISRCSQVALPALDSPSSCFHSSISSASSSAELSYPASPTAMDGMSFQGVKQSARVNEFLPVLEPCLSTKLSPHQHPDVQDIFPDSACPSSITVDDSRQQDDRMDFLSEDVSLDEDLIDLQLDNSLSGWEQTQSSKSSWDVHLSHDSEPVPDKDDQQNLFFTNDHENMLLYRSSSASSAGSECFGGSKSSNAHSTLHKQPTTVLGQSRPLQSSGAPSSSQMTSHSNCGTTICTFGNQNAQPFSYATQPKASLVDTPEPEVGVMQVDALPEKGKFLQAVVQAGPLLQNLLLAGPLPEWRYPPPQLNTVDIPKVPMASGSLLMKHYPSPSIRNNHAAMPIHHNPFVDRNAVVGHVNVPRFGGETGNSKTQLKGGQSSCNGGQKLCRLSSTGVK